MQELPFAGEHHGQPELVGACDDSVVADRSPGLYDHRDAGGRGGVDTVGEGIEAVSGGRAALGSAFGLLRRDLAGADTTLLADPVRAFLVSDRGGPESKSSRFEVLPGAGS